MQPLFVWKARNLEDCCKGSVQGLGYRLVEGGDAVKEDHTQTQCIAGLTAPIADKGRQQLMFAAWNKWEFPRNTCYVMGL